MEKVTVRDTLLLYNTELRSRIKNKDSKLKFENQLSESITLATNFINDPNHRINKYNIFKIYEPKKRLIMSLSIIEKIVNHYFTINVLSPKTEKYLDIRNCAARKGMGTTYAIDLIKKYVNKIKKDKFYVLKIDISKYFYNIDHNVLKEMLRPLLEDDEYTRLCNILDSTNSSYINKTISKIDNTLPLYKYDKGLPIGNLSSQVLSIFYLNKIDHYIVHDLRIPKYVRYMDDFILFHTDKQYLKECMNKIKTKLHDEYKLDISNKKTFIANGKSFNFLGYHFFINDNKKLVVNIRKETRDKIKRKIKEKRYLYDQGLITFEEAYSSISNYLYSYNYSYRGIIYMFD